MSCQPDGGCRCSPTRHCKSTTRRVVLHSILEPASIRWRLPAWTRGSLRMAREIARSRMLGRSCTTVVLKGPSGSRHRWLWLRGFEPAWSVKDQLAGLATAQPPPILDLRCAVMAHQLQHQVRGGSALPRTDCGSGRDKENGCSPWACHGPSASRCRHIRIVRSSQPILSALTSANADVSHRSGDTLPVYQS